jgi:serine/threonine protein kinase
MEPIDDRFVFSRPQLLSTGLHSQAVRFNFKPVRSRKTSAELPVCVLKFYSPDAQISYESELSVYQHVQVAASAELLCPKPIGYAEWSSAKYAKAIGRGIQRIVDGGDAPVFVLMLEYVEGSTTLSSVNVTPSVAKAAVSSLCKLHRLRVLHGDVSTNNALLMEEHDPARVVWVDFSAASMQAQERELALETKKAVEYFASLVSNYLATG